MKKKRGGSRSITPPNTSIPMNVFLCFPAFEVFISKHIMKHLVFVKNTSSLFFVFLFDGVIPFFFCFSFSFFFTCLTLEQHQRQQQHQQQGRVCLEHLQRVQRRRLQLHPRRACLARLPRLLQQGQGFLAQQPLLRLPLRGLGCLVRQPQRLRHQRQGPDCLARQPPRRRHPRHRARGCLGRRRRPGRACLGRLRRRRPRACSTRRR